MSPQLHMHRDCVSIPFLSTEDDLDLLSKKDTELDDLENSLTICIAKK